MILLLFLPLYLATKPSPHTDVFSWVKSRVRWTTAAEFTPLSFKDYATGNVMHKMKPMYAALASLLSSVIKPEVARSVSNRSIYSSSSDRLAFRSINITDVARSIGMGQVHCVEQFIDPADVRKLRQYVLDLQSADRFRPSGLSNKAIDASRQAFDANDRMVCPVTTDDIESNPTLSQIVDKMRELRVQLGATCTNRPSLSRSDLSHELYYSLSSKGAYLKRHLDERHEELKGRRGWTELSRRSVSWLLYLCDSDWNTSINGGALRSFHPSVEVRHGPCGSHEGDLQIGWLSHSRGSTATATEDFVEPVFLDCWRREGNSTIPMAELYTLLSDARSGAAIRRPISRTFPLHDESTGVTIRDYHPFLLDRSATAPVLVMLETLALPEAMESAADGPMMSCSVLDTGPLGGSLVMFDSVCVPHEVLTTIIGQRVALAGWFHEEVQAFPEWALST